MKFLNLTFMLSAAAFVHSTQVSVCYDNIYDDPSSSLTNVACSDGPHGMMSKYGFKTIGEFPCHVASFAGVSWGAETCGLCYSLRYEGETIYVLAIDGKPEGIDLSQKAMDQLTKGQAVTLGRVMVDSEPVSLDKCGLW